MGDREYAIENAKKFFHGWVEVSKVKIENFKSELDRENPFFAVESSRSIYQWTARQLVAKRILNDLNFIDNEEKVDNLHKIYQKEVNFRACSCVPNSTDSTSNLAELYLLQAYAEALEYIKTIK